MKKFLTIGTVIAGIGMAGFAGLWFLGKGEVERRVDLELAQLEAQGWKVTHAGRSVSGFPMGYAVTLDQVAATNTQTGMLVRLPTLTARVDAKAADTLHIDLPQSYIADIPFSELTRAESPGLPKILTVTGQSSDLVLTATGSALTGFALTLTGETLTAMIEQQDFAQVVQIQMAGLDAGMTAPPAPADVSRRLSLGSLKVTIAGNGDTKAPPTLITYDDLTVTAKSDLRTLEALTEAVYGGAKGTIDGAYQTGRSTTLATLGEAGQPNSGTLAMESASSTGLFNITAGRADLRIETRENAWTATPDEPNSPMRGTVRLDVAQAHYALPTAPAEEPSDMTLRLALLGATADAAVWDRLDPDGRLDRTPANLVVDLTGTMRMTRRIDRGRPGDGSPFEISNVTLQEASIEALGSAVAATGDVDILQPIMLPYGTLKLSLDKPTALITALRQIDLITPEIAQAGDAMLQVYAKPAEGDDQWTSDITFDHNGMTVNGLPVQ